VNYVDLRKLVETIRSLPPETVVYILDQSGKANGFQPQPDGTYLVSVPMQKNSYEEIRVEYGLPPTTKNN
jgi:hypothetical protein